MKMLLAGLILSVSASAQASIGSQLCPDEMAVAARSAAILKSKTASRAPVVADINASGISVDGLDACRSEIAEIYSSQSLSRSEKSELQKADRSLVVLIGFTTGQVF
jgi:hypothetical protein